MRFVKLKWVNSLSFKVLLAYVAGAVLSIALILAAGCVTVIYRGDILRSIDVAERAVDMSEMLLFDVNGVPVGFDDSEGDLASWLYESLRNEIGYRVLDGSGKVILFSAADGGFWPTDGSTNAPQRGRFTIEKNGVTIRGATEPIHRNGQTWFLQYAITTRFMELLYQFALPLMIAGITVFGLVLLFVFGTCAYITLRFTFKPLRAVSESAAAISPRSLHARLSTTAVPTEILPLVVSFNAALERLDHGYRRQQEFLATAAHELKTPLALIRGQIELGEPHANRGELLKDLVHMTRQVQQLLLLAEASEPQNYQLTMVDMNEQVDEAVKYLSRMADAVGVRFELPKERAAICWLADQGAVFTLLKNLLENAIQHTPPNTLIKVELGPRRLSIRDWGPGVPQDQLEQIFVRFWRGPHRRDSGAGLGLPICQEIAIAHGWTLQAERANPGLCIVLLLNSIED